jgi:hypothetical protein
VNTLANSVGRARATDSFYEFGVRGEASPDEVGPAARLVWLHGSLTWRGEKCRTRSIAALMVLAADPQKVAWRSLRKRDRSKPTARR